MLVVGRREGETIIIQTTDGEIVVSLERLQGTQARIGIEAPEQVKVLREELIPAEGSTDLPVASAN